MRRFFIRCFKKIYKKVYFFLDRFIPLWYNILKIEKQFKRQQHKLSRKYENFKKQKKGEAIHKNTNKQILKVQNLHKRIDDIRVDYINKTVNELVKTKPAYITIEDLNVSGMMKTDYESMYDETATISMLSIFDYILSSRK